jgi:PAS domain S-box-containing protein
MLGNNPMKDNNDNKLLEGRYRSLLQNSSDAISVLDENGIITFESSQKNRITEFEKEELIGHPIFEIVHPEDKDDVIDTFNYVKNNPNIEIKKEYRSLHKNKRWIYVESIFLNKLDNENISGIVVNSRDISERKRAELKERVYHNNLIFLSNSALDLLGLSDKDEIYKYIATRLHEYLENSMIVVCSYHEAKKTFSIEKTSGFGNIKTEIFARTKKMEYEIEIPIIDEINNELFTGKLITINLDEIEQWPIIGFSAEDFDYFSEKVEINKVYNISLARHNKILGNVSIITTHKSIIKFKHIIETFLHQVSVALHRSHLERELISAKDKAEESDKLKSAFLANMSHEIRTPMNGILGFAELLKDENISPGNHKKYIEIIDNNGKMLINLIDDIIDFSKIEAGQVKIIKKDFSLNSLLQQVHSSFLTENLINNKSKVKLRMRKALSNDSCYIKSDPNRLRQILTNLVGNAFKFTDEGFIEFGYQIIDDEMIEFYVKDTGIGIAQEKIDQIFNRFIQADNSSTRKYGGSGLGLAISRGFVDILGGKMWAESEVGSGSSFYFTVPYNPVEQVEEEVNKPIKKKQYDWKDRNILIAEDDKFSFKFLEGFLKQTNVNVLHAENGKLAVDICLENKEIDLVLMDIQMPEMNGYEATNLIKQNRKQLPVIAQTANAIIEEREKCFEAGCDDFVTKPVNIHELYSKIDKYFTNKD